MSISLPCTRDVFHFTFSATGITKKTTPKLGERYFVSFVQPNSTERFCNVIGKRYMSSLRRYHGRDARGNWSTTLVDGSEPISLTWSCKKKTNLTPCGLRVVEKEMVSVRFGVLTAVLKDEDIKKVMENEEAKDDGAYTSESHRISIINQLEDYKELALRRRLRVRSQENHIGRLKNRIKSLKLEVKELLEVVEACAVDDD